MAVDVAVKVAEAVVADLPELAVVAAQTFPLACPPSATRKNIEAFIDENLSAVRFGGYLAADERVVLTARDSGRMVGYAMTIDGVPDDDAVRRAVTLRPSVELSKIYVLPGSHGTGAAAALMAAALEAARERRAASVWLGVNQQNRRAQRFYAKHGFTINGTKTFRLGAGLEDDYVMVRPV